MARTKLLLIGLTLLSACASLGFTPEGICHRAGLANGSAEYRDCVHRVYAERRAQFWGQNQDLIAAGIASGLAATGNLRSGPSPSVTPPPAAGVESAGLPSRRLCPNGSYVYGDECRLAPDGSYVSGTPRLAPDGSYVGGPGPIRICPNGRYVAGSTCVLMPDGSYVGR